MRDNSRGIMEQQGVIISRPLWLNGEGHEASRLRRESDGKMCCLGFTLKQLANVTDEELNGKETPVDVVRIESRLPESLKWLLVINTDREDPWTHYSSDCGELMVFNDVSDDSDVENIVSQESRESKISQKFAEYDIKVTFVD